METLDEHRAAAIQRLENKRECKNHAVVYGTVNLMLVVIWAASGAGYFWPIWPIAGWGIALAFHARTVYGQRPLTEDDIQEEVKRSADHHAL